MHYYKIKDEYRSREPNELGSRLPDIFITHPDIVFPSHNALTGGSVTFYTRGTISLLPDYIEEIPVSQIKQFIEVYHKDSDTYILLDQLDSDVYRYDYHNSTAVVTHPATKVTYSIYDLSYSPIDDTDPNWSNPIYTNIRYDASYLTEQIRARYAFLDRPTNGKSNVIIDSFFPRILYKHRMNEHTMLEENLPATACAISPIVASMLNVRQVPTEQLCRALGYTLKDIKALLTKVKQRKLTFVFVGAGGTGMNTAHWLTELCELTHTVNLFKSVHAYDADQPEISNLLRFPIDIRKAAGTNGTVHKIDLIEPYVHRLSTNKPVLSRSFIPSDRGYLPSEYTTYDSATSTKTAKPNIVFYGAPDIATRQYFYNVGNFICATHAANSCSVWLNPHQDSDLQSESYGLIQLGSFFMNQLRMAISLLEILSDDTIDLQAKDQELLDYSFDGTLRMRTDRTYTWQIEHDANMLTEAEAVNF